MCVHICAYACTVKIHWFITQKTAFYPIVEYSGNYRSNPEPERMTIILCLTRILADPKWWNIWVVRGTSLCTVEL